MKRTASITRNTKETQIQAKLNLDGKGTYKISTGIPFFDHMLELFSKHGLFDLQLKARGDLHVDAHHTVEDIGICIGKAVNEALGRRTGIERYASLLLPMDEALCEVAIDISGRPHLSLKGRLPRRNIGKFDPTMARDFLDAFVVNSAMTLHINIRAGESPHHTLECLFKALGVTLSRAVAINPRKKGIPSTKGII